MKHTLKILIAASPLLVLAGCYTVIDHPDIETTDENGYQYTTKVYYYDDCSSCHEGVDEHGNYTKVAGMSKATGNNGVTESEESLASSETDYYPDGEIQIVDENGLDDYYHNFGDVRPFYGHPWWHDVVLPTPTARGTAPGSSAHSTSRTRSGETETTDRGDTDRPERKSTVISIPNATSNSGSNEPAPTSTSGSQSNSSNDKQNTVSKTNTNQDSGRQSSSDTPKSRNNDGSRNDKGRR